jgi:hydrogenase maturation protein HypF
MEMERRSIRIEGIVQGVGFRPFVYQLARRQGITGWVRNDSRGVLIEAQGEKEALARFLDGLRDEHPPLAAISRFETTALPPIAESGFPILASDATHKMAKGQASKLTS